MSKIPFDEKELKVVGETPNRLGGGTAKRTIGRHRARNVWRYEATWCRLGQRYQGSHVLMGGAATAPNDIDEMFVEERPHFALEHLRRGGVVVVLIGQSGIGEYDDAMLRLRSQTARQLEYHCDVRTAVETHGKDAVGRQLFDGFNNVLPNHIEAFWRAHRIA